MCGWFAFKHYRLHHDDRCVRLYGRLHWRWDMDINESVCSVVFDELNTCEVISFDDVWFWSIQWCWLTTKPTIYFLSIGAAGVLVGHPLDTIKTWQQMTNTGVGRAMFKIVVRNNGVSMMSYNAIVYFNYRLCVCNSN